MKGRTPLQKQKWHPPSGSQAAGRPHLRAIKFSIQENKLVIAGVLEHYVILFGNWAAMTSKASKSQIWCNIAQSISRCSGVQRSREQVAHRYWDFKVQLKAKVAARNKYIWRTEGGAPCPIIFTPMEERLVQRLGPDVFEDITERLDTMQAATALAHEAASPSQ
ncbi:myb-related transcription factor, partner of profilin-like [Rhinatrema bivittatum]|uniref:myb-related transcription factor, partner of profilin-like n=1 Tax=Rhinatrema bivittatum TaxID=194408 RepID=UPI001127DC65|nr:myb-related transcription factor, partner of profilin-like [Rhinatrema bivittatum]